SVQVHMDVCPSWSQFLSFGTPPSRHSMAMTGLKVLSFRWILLGCIGALVVYQSVDVFLSYRAAASSAALATHRRAFRPLKAPDDNDLLHMNQLMADCLTKGEGIIS
ncbi:hypothetical protein DYB32_002445, partial [Aphanomyces invadans]